jgi:hypothetical protein
MLAALIATRQATLAPKFFYTNQFIAATNTFVCITVCRRAAHICTSRPIQEQLAISTPGQESILDQLNRFYYRVINFLSSDANMIPLPLDLYLSDQIAGVIATATVLTGILSTLPVAPQNVLFRTRLQIELASALANLRALGVPV